MSKKKSNISRRNYLKLSLLGTGALISPSLLMGSSSVFSDKKLNIALIGGGNIAKSAFKDCRNENVVAIADVDYVTGIPAFEAFPQAKRYKDFRKMLEAHQNELDLVIVSTPDHTHFAATYAAMQLGIAVHTQKPLTHNIWQARTLQAAAKKFNVQTVMGNQGHNYEGMRLMKDWADSGICGEILEIHAWTGRTTKNNANAKLKYPKQPIPDTLDWDLWQGPSSTRDYNKEFCPKNWRWHWEYGCGALGDIGCHTLDIPIYTLGLGYPSAVYTDKNLDYRSEFDGAKTKEGAITVIYEFPATATRPATKIYWYEGGRMPKFPKAIHDFTSKEKNELTKGGCIMIGENNTILSPGMKPSNPRLLNNWEEIKNNPVKKTTPRAVGNPIQEIKAAIRGEITTCGSNFDYAVPLTETVLLGTIAIRTNKKVIYDPETMSFTDTSLNTYIKEPTRSEWEYGLGLIGPSLKKKVTKELFNGTDLTGWTYKDSAPFIGKVASSDKRFSVKKGVFTVNKGPGIQKIWSTDVFSGDFELSLYFRAGINADSGIYLRGPQLQCRDYLAVGPYKNLKNYKPQDWNHILVVVKGKTATCTCNGELLAFDRDIPAKGSIGLEADKEQMEYRNIILTQLE